MSFHCKSLDGLYKNACDVLKDKKAQALNAVQTQKEGSQHKVEAAYTLLRNQGGVAGLEDDDKKKAETCIDDSGVVVVLEWPRDIRIIHGKDKAPIIISKGAIGKFAFSFTLAGKPRFVFGACPGVSKMIPWKKIKIIPSSQEESDNSDSDN